MPTKTYRKLRHWLKHLFDRKSSGNTVASEKSVIREEVKRMKFSLTSEDKQQQAQAVFRKIEQLPEFVNSRTLLMYWSMPDELPTHEFITKWSVSKKILLPVVKGNDMTVRLFTGTDDLKKGKWKIMEPVEKAAFIRQIDLVIVPGIAFDKKRHRLGRGGGYYDRYLKRKDIKKWGIGFNFQLFETVPTAAFDIKMDKIITPDQIVE